MTREEYIQGLRDLAKFVEDHPEMGDPRTGWARHNLIFNCSSREEAIPLVRALGKTRKEGKGDILEVSKTFAGDPRAYDRIFISIDVRRDQVCKRIVTGTREVPEQHYPAHTEEIVEWECEEPLLKEVHDE